MNYDPLDYFISEVTNPPPISDYHTMVDLGNGAQLSILWGDHCQSSARFPGQITDPDACFEVGLIFMDERGFYPLDEHSDVICFVRREEIAALIARVVSVDPVTMSNIEPHFPRDPLNLWYNRRFQERHF